MRVKFGSFPVSLPENFYEVHKKWKNKEITLKQAAKEWIKVCFLLKQKHLKSTDVGFGGKIKKVYFFSFNGYGREVKKTD